MKNFRSKCHLAGSLKVLLTSLYKKSPLGLKLVLKPSIGWYRLSQERKRERVLMPFIQAAKHVLWCRDGQEGWWERDSSHWLKGKVDLLVHHDRSCRSRPKCHLPTSTMQTFHFPCEHKLAFSSFFVHIDTKMSIKYIAVVCLVGEKLTEKPVYIIKLEEKDFKLLQQEVSHEWYGSSGSPDNYPEMILLLVMIKICRFCGCIHPTYKYFDCYILCQCHT